MQWGRGNILSQILTLRVGFTTNGSWEIRVDLEEALGYIFGCFREGFGPLKFFFSSLFSPMGPVGVGIKESR